MKQKTTVHAEDGKQEVLIQREFDLPLDLLFSAYIEPEFVAEWMGTTVLKLESKKHGSFHFETRDKEGNLRLTSSGVIHELIMNQSIIRTFEMENTSFPPQLEFLSFEKISDGKSKLTMKVIYKSVAVRDEILKMPFVYGINRAHEQLENLFKH